VLSEYAIFSYKCDEFYNPEADRGIRYDDPALNIDWRIPKELAVISDKDKLHPLFADAEMNFKFE
jgi:dTDP-4-dehydrorhamnose 3,5-epimerase